MDTWFSLAAKGDMNKVLESYNHANRLANTIDCKFTGINYSLAQGKVEILGGDLKILANGLAGMVIINNFISLN